MGCLKQPFSHEDPPAMAVFSFYFVDSGDIRNFSEHISFRSYEVINQSAKARGREDRNTRAYRP
jgi:hypothetical protein